MLLGSDWPVCSLINLSLPAQVFLTFWGQGLSATLKQTSARSSTSSCRQCDTASISKLRAVSCTHNIGACVERCCAVDDEAIRRAMLCKLVLSHDYGHVLSHDGSHDVVTHDAPCSLSPDGCLHSLKDASTHVFAELHIFPQKNQYL